MVAASTFMHVDSANIFVGDDNPEDSLFLTIKNVKFPDLEEITKSHLGGGAAGEVTLGTRAIRPLALTFQLEGFDMDRVDDFMPSSPARINYTVRANQRNLITHTDLGIKAVIGGRMTKMATSEFSRENGITTDFEINEVLFYTLHVGGKEKFYFNYFQGLAGIRKNGVPIFEAAARNLGLI